VNSNASNSTHLITDSEGLALDSANSTNNTNETSEFTDDVVEDKRTLLERLMGVDSFFAGIRGYIQGFK